MRISDWSSDVCSSDLQVVSSLQDAVEGMDLMVVTHQAGLTVQEMTALRRRARDAGARFKVTKNRLAKRALDGTAFAEVSDLRSEEHTSELQSLMRNSYAVFCLKKKTNKQQT